MAVLLREAIGDSIRRARTERRRTLRDVSGAARVSLGYLSEIERGRKEPSSELLAAICDALAMTLPDLLDDAADAMRPVRRAPLVDSALRSAVEAAFGATGEGDLGAAGEATGSTASAESATAPSGDAARAQADGFHASATDPTVPPDALADGPGADGAAAGELAGDPAGAVPDEADTPGTVLLVARLPVTTGDRGLVAAA